MLRSYGLGHLSMAMGSNTHLTSTNSNNNHLMSSSNNNHLGRISNTCPSTALYFWITRISKQITFCSSFVLFQNGMNWKHSAQLCYSHYDSEPWQLLQSIARHCYFENCICCLKNTTWRVFPQIIFLDKKHVYRSWKRRIGIVAWHGPCDMVQLFRRRRLRLRRCAGSRAVCAIRSWLAPLPNNQLNCYRAFSSTLLQLLWLWVVTTATEHCAPLLQSMAI